MMSQSKYHAVETFVARMKEQMGDRIWGMYIFGSAAKGTAEPESDIDVLVIYSGIDEEKLLEVVSATSFDIVCEQGQFIEVVPMSLKEYKESLGRCPFLWEVLKFGKPIFVGENGTEWKLEFTGYLDLAREYLRYAKDALQEGKLRLAIDTAYNCAELLVKALIVSAQEPLARSHGGIIGQFGKLFVLSGKVDAELGRRLNLGLELRAKARYNPKSLITLENAHAVVNLADDLLEFAEKCLRDGPICFDDFQRI